jgi:plastocyanin domain-containing protein
MAPSRGGAILTHEKELEMTHSTGPAALAVAGWRAGRDLRWVLFPCRSRATAKRGAVQQCYVRVKGVYMSAEIHIKAGLPARLVFRREETAPCSERVAFPDLGISVERPAFQDVAIDLPACEPGERRFCCQMDISTATWSSSRTEPLRR